MYRLVVWEAPPSGFYRLKYIPESRGAFNAQGNVQPIGDIQG